MKLGPFHPTIKTGNGELLCRRWDIAATGKPTGDSCRRDDRTAGSCSPGEIANEVMERYTGGFRKLLQPTGQEFTDDVVEALLAKVKTHELLTVIEGVDLVDQDTIALGNMRSVG